MNAAKPVVTHPGAFAIPATLALPSIAQPDITLLLDVEGVIREISLSEALSREKMETWIGRPWADTVGAMAAEQVQRALGDSRRTRVSVFGEVAQRFPSGLELLMEYTTVHLGGKAGMVAIGRNLQVVTELQTRLVAAQQAMERDYWKLREVETRYRLLFNASHEAVLLVRASDLRIVEANPAASRALGLPLQRPAGTPGRELLPLVAAEEREAFQAALARAREQGKAPALRVHFGRDRESWYVRASLVASAAGPVFLLQLAPGAGLALAAASEPTEVGVEALIERGPDGFVVIDREGTVLKANRAALDLVQVGPEGTAVGSRLGKWLGRPGADVGVLLSMLQRHGMVRLFSTTIQGEHGLETHVEIAAVGNAETGSRHFALMIRDVGRRLPDAGSGERMGSMLDDMSAQIGKTSLPRLMKETVGTVEKHLVEVALGLTGWNRTAAAQLLGLSRQSLYAKLDRYGLGADGGTAAEDRD